MPSRHPDPSFVRELEAIDERLKVVWDDRVNRWTVFRTAPRLEFVGKEGDTILTAIRDYDYPVWTVELPDGGHAELGAWVLEYLRMCDTHRRSIEEQARELKAKWDAAEAAEKKRLDNHYSDLVDDTMSTANKLYFTARG